jgi:hypothetical protein
MGAGCGRDVCRERGVGAASGAPTGDVAEAE